MRRIAARVLLLALSTALCLVLVEQLLRVAGFEYRPMSIEVASPTDARLFHLFEDEHFAYDPELIWRPQPGVGVFNRQGFRGPVLEEGKLPGEIRIFALGDSNTLGWAGQTGPNWPQDLGEMLARLDDRVEVVNAGVWGYSSFQGTLRLREALAFSPDVVLVSFGSNDAHRVRRGDREFARGSLLGRDSLRRLLHFRTAQLAAAAWDRVAAGGGELGPRVGLEEYRENLRQMAAEARAAGALPVFLTRPFTGPVNDPGWWKAYGHTYNLATVEVAAEVGAPVVDLYTIFRERPDLFSDESHFTREGHRRAARVVVQHLVPILRRETSFRPRPPAPGPG
ncbi:MAG: GDSL-type esterase/lipase family protein [Thermoanaerobaculia bacterium]|nr:GDSL-type esterase/lipase family protein [Thermoanaerobaculia bacterium]